MMVYADDVMVVLNTQRDVQVLTEIILNSVFSKSQLDQKCCLCYEGLGGWDAITGETPVV